MSESMPARTGNEPSPPLVEVRGLVKHFAARRLFGGSGEGIRAVDGVDLFINSGETLGLVGESGCGKSTTGRLLLRLIEPTRGSVRFDGTELTTLDAGRLRAMRRRMQIVFQDPYGSLNPRITVGDAITEAFVIHKVDDRAGRARRLNRLLDLVKMPQAAAQRYPHEFSGGQRQRIAIARALALDPDFIVCDEAVSALDVSVQAQIINLLQDLQRDLGLTYLFISHNLAVVRHISSRIAVMYLGQIVETADADRLFLAPRHPYTRALLAAVPPSHPSLRRGPVVTGDLPPLSRVRNGCRFAPRCAFVEERCRQHTPALLPGPDGSAAACHRVEDGTLPWSQESHRRSADLSKAGIP
jgi:peptide/nickel transport system ATP-binding protein/oligopeptide transport system ATP-binding protein